MPAEHRPAPITRETIHRVYRLGEELRAALQQRRQTLGQTVREFVAEAVETELPDLLEILRQHLPRQGGEARPMRLPLTEPLLARLKEASAETGVPATRLLLACLSRAAGRKRRKRGTAPRAGRGEQKPQAPQGNLGRRRRRAAAPASPPPSEEDIPVREKAEHVPGTAEAWPVAGKQE